MTNVMCKHGLVNEPFGRPCARCAKESCDRITDAFTPPKSDTPANVVPVDLDAIRARADAATEGPWALVVERDGDELYECRIDGLERLMYREDWGEDPDEAEQSVVNAEFIAHSRTDVPAMADEISRLRAQLAHTTEYNQVLIDRLATVLSESAIAAKRLGVLEALRENGAIEITDKGIVHTNHSVWGFYDSLTEAADTEIARRSELSQREKENG